MEVLFYFLLSRSFTLSFAISLDTMNWSQSNCLTIQMVLLHNPFEKSSTIHAKTYYTGTCIASSFPSDFKCEEILNICAIHHVPRFCSSSWHSCFPYPFRLCDIESRLNTPHFVMNMLSTSVNNVGGLSFIHRDWFANGIYLGGFLHVTLPTKEWVPYLYESSWW